MPNLAPTSALLCPPMVLVTPYNAPGLPHVDPFYGSRTLFERSEWQSNAGRLHQEGRRYGILKESRVGDQRVHSIHYAGTLDTVRTMMGVDNIPSDFGGLNAAVQFQDDLMVAAFEFYLLTNEMRPHHPMTRITYVHALGMARALDCDAMTLDQYRAVVRGPEGNLELPTPNGKLVGENGERYVHGSFGGQTQTGTDDVNNRAEGPFGTKDYAGNAASWIKGPFHEQDCDKDTRNWIQHDPRGRNQCGHVGGDRHDYDPDRFSWKKFSPCYPNYHYGYVGFPMARPV